VGRTTIIRETEEDPEPRSLSFNVFEVTSTGSVEIEDEIEESPDWEVDCGRAGAWGTSARLDLSKVDTKDRPTSPVEEASVNEVEGNFDKTSAFVWGIEAVRLETESPEEEVELVLGVDSENDSCWILVRNIVFTESMEPWPSTSWLATRSVKFSNTRNRSVFEEDATSSRTWTIATESNDPNTELDKEEEESSNEWAWLNERESISSTGPLESTDSSAGDWVTDERDESRDKTFPSLTSASLDATANKPATNWDRISRRVDISADVIAQSSPMKSASHAQVASHTLSIRPQVETISPDSEFTNLHTPWPEQSDTLQALLFIAHMPEEQLSQLAQSALVLQLLELVRSTKLDSFTQIELSFPDTPI
jgi:hypothetical protein